MTSGWDSVVALFPPSTLVNATVEPGFRLPQNQLWLLLSLDRHETVKPRYLRALIQFRRVLALLLQLLEFRLLKRRHELNMYCQPLQPTLHRAKVDDLCRWLLPCHLIRPKLFYKYAQLRSSILVDLGSFQPNRKHNLLGCRARHLRAP